MNELFETVAKIAASGADFHVFKFKYTDKWACAIERKDDGIELKVRGEGNSCPEALADACDKWARITGGIKEFAGALLEHTPAPLSELLDDNIPF